MAAILDHRLRLGECVNDISILEGDEMGDDPVRPAANGTVLDVLLLDAAARIRLGVDLLGAVGAHVESHGQNPPSKEPAPPRPVMTPATIAEGLAARPPARAGKNS